MSSSAERGAWPPLDKAVTGSPHCYKIVAAWNEIVTKPEKELSK
jgi:hypothetical protein